MTERESDLLREFVLGAMADYYAMLDKIADAMAKFSRSVPRNKRYHGRLFEWKIEK